MWCMKSHKQKNMILLYFQDEMESGQKGFKSKKQKGNKTIPFLA